MDYIFTLVTPPHSLTQSIIQQLQDDYPSLHLKWLSQEEALDLLIPLSFVNEREVLELYQELHDKICNQYQADLFITTAQHRQKKLLIADMDSTIIQNETLDDLAQEVGIGQQVAEITARAMNGELDFSTALTKRVSLLKKVPTHFLDKTWEKTNLNEGAITLVKTMKKHHAYTALVSGGFTFFTEKVAQICGFDEHHANQLNFRENRLDGTVVLPVLGKEAKLSQLQRLMKQLDLSAGQTMAIGDGANDLPMLTHAGLGIGYYPKPVVAGQVLNKIQHTSLRSALFVQGYTISQFV